MNKCVSCGSPNDDSARFCTICGRKLMPLPVGHDFTTGVMRYVPETEAVLQTDIQPQAGIPAQAGSPVQSGIPVQTPIAAPAEIPDRKKQVNTVTLAVICAILGLVLLIVIGIAYLLGGVF